MYLVQSNIGQVSAQERLEDNIKCSDERMSLLANRMLRVLSAVQTLD